jgi:hypothetical protein
MNAAAEADEAVERHHFPQLVHQQLGPQRRPSVQIVAGLLPEAVIIFKVFVYACFSLEWA